MADTEEMDLSEFDSAPGQSVSSDKPAPEPAGEIDISPDEALESPEPTEQAVPDQQAEAAEPSTDYEELKSRIDELETQNQTLRSATGRLGTELEQRNAQIQALQGTAGGVSQPQAPAYDEDEPVTVGQLRQHLAQLQQQNFLMQQMKTDVSFKSKVNPSKEVDELVRAHQMLENMPSWKVAYNDLVADGFIKPQASKPKPSRKVAVQTKPGPVQTGGTPRSGSVGSDEGPAVDYEKFDKLTDEGRAALMKKLYG